MFYLSSVTYSSVIVQLAGMFPGSRSLQVESGVNTDCLTMHTHTVVTDPSSAPFIIILSSLTTDWHTVTGA